MGYELKRRKKKKREQRKERKKGKWMKNFPSVVYLCQLFYYGLIGGKFFFCLSLSLSMATNTRQQ